MDKENLFSYGDLAEHGDRNIIWASSPEVLLTPICEVVILAFIGNIFDLPFHYV